MVDASLLWACVPFGRHALLQAADPLMRGTAAKIERDLVGGTGGVHRYRADTFYGGGEWVVHSKPTAWNGFLPAGSPYLSDHAK